jgi:hypothetical protein
MRFNQHNHNTGDVNNAISAKGNVVQTTGSGNRVQVDHPKTGIWSWIWKKIKGCWKWFIG